MRASSLGIVALALAGALWLGGATAPAIGLSADQAALGQNILGGADDDGGVDDGGHPDKWTCKTTGKTCSQLVMANDGTGDGCAHGQSSISYGSGTPGGSRCAPCPGANNQAPCAVETCSNDHVVHLCQEPHVDACEDQSQPYCGSSKGGHCTMTQTAVADSNCPAGFGYRCTAKICKRKSGDPDYPCTLSDCR